PPVRSTLPSTLFPYTTLFRSILHDPTLHIAATCVRVPVPIGHSESVLIETGDKISASDARLILGEAPGMIVEDDPHAKLYPTPQDRKSTRLNSSHVAISYAVF